MSFLDYFKKDQHIDFEIVTDGIERKYSSIVDEISETAIIIRITEDDFNIKQFKPGSKGVVSGKRKELQFSLDVEIVTVKKPSCIELKRIPSRSYLRVNAFIIMEYKKITDKSEFEKRKKYILNMSSDCEDYLFSSTHQGSEEIEPASSIPSEMLSEIHSIHRKLDYIIKLLGKSDEENIFNRDLVDVNLSGSGIKFKCMDELQPGDCLDIKLVLPVSSRIIIELIGEIVRTVRLSEQDEPSVDNRYESAVKFAVINEDDREFIIRYVFRRQRELLRAEEST